MWMSRTRGVQFHELIHIRLIRWVGSVFIRLFFMCVTNSLSAVSRTHSYVTHRRVGTVFMWVFLICLSRTRWVQYPELIHIWLIRRVGTVFMHVFFMCVSRTHRVPWVSHMHSFTWFIDESALCLCMVLYVCVTNSWISLSITRSFMHSCMIHRRDGSVFMCVLYMCVTNSLSRTRGFSWVRSFMYDIQTRRQCVYVCVLYMCLANSLKQTRGFPWVSHVHSCMTYRRDGSVLMCLFFTCVSQTRCHELDEASKNCGCSVTYECVRTIHVSRDVDVSATWRVTSCVCHIHDVCVTNSTLSWTTHIWVRLCYSRE